ncbi:MAG: hypothetical protein GVY36_04495 [Verrucomicrobia bacterium]|jgi:hypothetical protein|nr:hypothetical protein [Verrucomicrobiota bacterium]
MHTRLVSYLQDNRDQIIENWLTEVEVPAPARSPGGEDGVVPYAFLADAFDSVLGVIRDGRGPDVRSGTMHLENFLGITCECEERCFGGRVCMELHDAGLEAFMSVFESSWDTEHEFNAFDREYSKDLINQALSGFFGQEIERCPHRQSRNDCPFVTQHLPQL